MTILSRLCRLPPSSGGEPHLRLLYFRMFEEKLFYLCRVDVLPSSDDQILHPSFNLTVSQTVHAGRVAAVKNNIKVPLRDPLDFPKNQSVELIHTQSCTTEHL